jgi:hypothetical protein
MRTHVHESAELGELVVAVFDQAARYSTDPRVVSRLATQVVRRMLRGAQKRPLSSPRPTLRLAGTMAAEKDVRDIRNAAFRMLLSQRRALHGATEREIHDHSDRSRQWW